jgi:hypothetical protein
MSGYVFQMHEFPGALRGPQDHERRAVLMGFGSPGGGDRHRF